MKHISDIAFRTEPVYGWYIFDSIFGSGARYYACKITPIDKKSCMVKDICTGEGQEFSQCITFDQIPPQYTFLEFYDTFEELLEQHAEEFI